MRLETSQMRKLRLKEGLSCLTPYSRFWLSPVITLFQVLQPEVWLWHDPETSKTQRAGTGKPILSALWTVFSFYEKEVWLHLWSRMCCLWGLPGDLAAKNPSAMQETQVWSLGQEDCLEEEMGTHFSILAWRISGTEEPGRLHPWVHKEFIKTEQLSLSLSLAMIPMDVVFFSFTLLGVFWVSGMFFSL